MSKSKTYMYHDNLVSPGINQKKNLSNRMHKKDKETEEATVRQSTHSTTKNKTWDFKPKILDRKAPAHRQTLHTSYSGETQPGRATNLFHWLVEHGGLLRLLCDQLLLQQAQLVHEAMTVARTSACACMSYVHATTLLAITKVSRINEWHMQ